MEPATSLVVFVRKGDIMQYEAQYAEPSAQIKVVAVSQIMDPKIISGPLQKSISIHKAHQQIHLSPANQHAVCQYVPLFATS